MESGGFRSAGIRRRYEKRHRRGGRWLLLTILVVSVGILFGIARRLGGLIGVVLAVLGLVAILKALLFACGKASDVLFDWWSRQPTWVCRPAAAALFLFGCLMQAVLRWGSATP